MASSATIHKLQDEIRQEIEKASAEAEEHKRLAKGYEESATVRSRRLFEHRQRFLTGDCAVCVPETQEAALRLEEEGVSQIHCHRQTLQKNHSRDVAIR